MAKSTKPTNPYDAQHLKNLKKYEGKLNYLFAVASGEAAKAGIDLEKSVGDASFIDILDKLPKSVGKSLDSILNDLYSGVHKTIVSGIKEEWKLANSKNDALVEQIFGKDIRKDLSKRMRERYFGANQDVQNAFVERKEKGMELSDKVWNLTEKFKEEMEMGIAVGLKEGRTAQELSRDLRSYLNNPQALFRRVRREPGGPLVLSKHARQYHPGRGVYRSAYKNALRLAGTEINIAYRTADHERWQKMDFVVGIHIGLSNNHTLNGKPLTDICDSLAGDYPKDFKFTGWHPHCRCIATTILKSDEEIEKDAAAIGEGREPTPPEESGNYVKDTPAGFNDWVMENADRIGKAAENGTLPYFVADNQDGVNSIINGTGWANVPEPAKEELPKTLQEIDDAIAKFQYNDPKLVARREEIEAKMKELFDNNDFGLDISADLLEKVFDTEFKNTFQTGTSVGFNDSDRTSGPIETEHRRLVASHRMFLPSTANYLEVGHDRYNGPQLDRSEYEKYGHLLDRDKTRDWLKNDSGYGENPETGDISRAAVRFKKDRVHCTWAYNDSLNMKADRLRSEYCQPSTVENPDIASFDMKLDLMLRGYSLVGYDSVDEWLQSDDWKNLPELQRRLGSDYIELQFHGKLTIDDVESITLEASPVDVLGEDLVGKLLDKGIELWYWNGSEVVQYSAKPTALEIAAQRHAARTAEETKAKWDAFYARRKKYAKIVDEANAAIAEAKEYKDLDVADLKGMVDKFDLNKAQKLTEEMEKAVSDMKEAENKLSDLIPDVHKWHGQFTIDQLNAVHDAVEKKLNYIGKFSLEKQVDKLKFEANDYLGGNMDGVQQKYATWEVSQAAYLQKLQDVEYRFAVQNLQADLTEAVQWSGDHLKYKNLKNYVLDFNTAVASGADIVTLEAKAQLIRDEYAVKLAEETAKEAAEAAAKKTTKADADPSDPFSKERKDKALWDKKGGKEAAAALFDTACKSWLGATETMKDEIYGYTGAYCHINEPLEDRPYQKPQTRAAFEKSVLNIEKYIEGSKLPCDMWLQRGDDDLSAIIGRLNFMGNSMPTNLQDLVGMEMQEGGFMSFGSAKGKGFSEKNVILNVYAPKGTEIAYCEPFSRYGYGATRGLKNSGRNWDGVGQIKRLSRELESLLQRGSVLRIIKVEDNRPNGKIYIDCEVVRQEKKNLKYVKNSWIGY